MLSVCVTALGRMIATDSIVAESTVLTENTLPYPAVAEAAPMVGRGPLNRYGGE